MRCLVRRVSQRVSQPDSQTAPFGIHSAHNVSHPASPKERRPNSLRFVASEGYRRGQVENVSATGLISCAPARLGWEAGRWSDTLTPRRAVEKRAGTAISVSRYHAVNDLSDLDSARWFAALARDLAEQQDRDATTHRILELISGATGCSFASIAHLTPQGVLAYDHSTDKNLLGKVAAISLRTGEGVAWQALRERGTVHVPDLHSEDRWPQYTARMRAETNIRSVLGYCLIVDNLVRGAMLLYSEEPNFFTDSICRFAEVYADHAAIALAKVSDHE